MKRRNIALFLLVLLFSSCSSLPQKSGFSLVQKDPQGVEQPYLAVTTEQIEFKEIKTLMTVMIPLDLSDVEWVGELGVVKITEKDKRDVLRREVWRGFVKVNGKINGFGYPAVIDELAAFLFLLVPNVTQKELIGCQAGVLSGAGTRILSPVGAIHNLKKGEKITDYFAQNTSRIERWQVVDFSPGTPEGDIFISKMTRRFPILLTIGGKNLMATKNVVETSEMTAQDNMIDRIISNGKLPASLMTFLSFSYPVIGAIQTTRIFFGLAVAANDKEMYGPYGETLYPGWAVGKVLGYYLRNNHTRIFKRVDDYLKWKEASR